MVFKPNLSGVPETMLWTLYNRALGAPEVLNDPEAIRVCKAIDYDYAQSFGPPEPSHAIRSLIFDEAIERFLEKHPNGVIVNLGEGLETQRFRVKGADAIWVSVDLPDAIDVRECFISSDAKHRHIRCSALDQRWFEGVPKGRPVFVTAQGLFMFFEEREVQALLAAISRTFPEAWLMFNTIPKSLSKQSLLGWKKTEHYTMPKMPWGIDKEKLAATLRLWIPTPIHIEDQPWQPFPGVSVKALAARSALTLVRCIRNDQKEEMK